MNNIIQLIDIIFMVTACWTCLWVTRQAYESCGAFARVFQFIMFGISGSLMFKIFERLEGSFASPIDLSRDGFYMLLFIFAIFLHKHKFGSY